MSIRRGFWFAGLVVAGVVASVLRDELSPVPLAMASGAAALLVGLIGELRSALLLLGQPSTPRAPEGAQPADGHVEVIALRGASGESNLRDPRFSAFRALNPQDNLPGRERLRGPTRTPPPLLGKVAIVSVFLGRDGRTWSDAEIAESHAALFRAGLWIEREAARWEVPVNVALADTYFVVDDDTPDDVEMAFQVEGDGVGPLEARASTKAIVEMTRSAAALGFHDVAAWMDQIDSRVAADALVWLLHPRRRGRSLAIPLDYTDLSGVSLAVCYAGESSFPEPLAGPPYTDPVTIAHELLHLFGATDKYGRSLRSYPERSVTARDIMRLSEWRLSRLRVDSRTARELGWSARPSEPAEALDQQGY